MKKIIIPLLALLIGGNFTAFAQKVSFKKDIVSVNKVQIGKVDMADGVITLSDMNGTPKLTAKFTDKTPDGNPAPGTFIICTPDNSKCNQMQLNYLWINMKNNLVKNIESQTKIFTAQGIDDIAIDEFFAKPNTLLFDIDKEIAKEAQVILENKLEVLKNGNILQNGNLVGTVQRIEEQHQMPRMQFYDLNKKSMGYYYIRGREGESISIHSFNKEIPIVARGLEEPDLSKNKTVMGAIAQLWDNGITFGRFDQKIATAMAEKKAAEIESKKGDSKNFYDVDGIVLDKSGNKIGGKITAEFEDLSADSDVKQSGTEFESMYLSNTITREKYNAADAIHFYVKENGEYVHFMGISITGDFGSALLNWAGDRTFFAKVEAENDGNYILSNRLYPDVFYLQVKGNPLAFILQTTDSNDKEKKPEKIQDQLNKYLKCKNITYSDYNFKSLEDVKKLLNDYVNNCK